MSNPLSALPAHAVNGVAVALGIAAVHALVAALAGPLPAQLAVAGAVCTSLADLPGTGPRNLQRVLRAALLATLAAAVVVATRPWPVALGLSIAAMTGLAMLTMAWGARAGPVSFAPVLALVFTMAVPHAVPAGVVLGWHAGGAALYVAWAAASNALLQRRYRTLALAAAVEAMAHLLRSRAGVLDHPADPRSEDSLRNWVGDEAALADALQAARDLLFDAASQPAVQRQAALLLRVIDLRDGLLASRLDLDLLGDDAAAAWVRGRVAQALREVSAVLDAVAGGLRSGTAAPVDVPSFTAWFDGGPLPAADPRQRLLPVLATRLQQLADDAARMQALLQGAEAALPVPREELLRFVAPEAWPLKALGAQLTLRSPVLRHALRAALALGSAYALGRMLPWAAHPHWLVLSVAVVLRGNLEQTLARRNARVTGTLIGCVLVLALARVPALQPLAFLVAVGVAHAFVTARYLVTAVAATVMALLLSHQVEPAGGFAISERVADTLLGALLAWAFSYVLPSWERRGLPRTVNQAMAALQAYAAQALQRVGDAGVAQRLARRQAYDALGLLAVALQRSAVEPQGVRLPQAELTRLLDHAHRLMAHLSAIRLMLVRRARALDSGEAEVALAQARERLQGWLQLPVVETAGDAAAPVTIGSLPSEKPEYNPMPWLLRRLQLAAQDAEAVGRCAEAVCKGARRVSAAKSMGR